jgi:hypothetical protein
MSSIKEADAMLTSKLDAGSIIALVADGKDLADHLDADVRSRFELLIESFNSYGTIPAEARASAIEQIARGLRNRLEVARDRTLYPAIADEVIEKPIFVVGSPRTGTTILQCLLDQDDANRIAHYWQTFTPSPPPGARPETVADRIAAEDRNVVEMVAAIPRFLSAHPYLDLGGLSELEDEDIFSLDFHCAFPQRYYKVPVLPVWSAPTDPAARFPFHRKFLQHMQYGLPARRWVCKGTSHQFDLPSLWQTYPDATCVWPHRDPVAFIGSLFELVDLIYGPISGTRDGAFVRGMLGHVHQGYMHALGSAWIDDPRIVHIRFTDLVQDHIGTIRRIYAHIGETVSDAFEANMHRWLDDPANASDRHGKFHYSLERFGISKSEVREMFADYYLRFGLN